MTVFLLTVVDEHSADINRTIPGFTITFSANILHYGVPQLVHVILLLICIRKIHVSNLSVDPNNLTVVNRSRRANARTIRSFNEVITDSFHSLFSLLTITNL